MHGHGISVPVPVCAAEHSGHGCQSVLLQRTLARHRPAKRHLTGPSSLLLILTLRSGLIVTSSVLIFAERAQVCHAPRPAAAVDAGHDMLRRVHLHHHRLQVLPRVLQVRRCRQVHHTPSTFTIHHHSCGDLVSCLWFHLNFGLRAGGGIGDEIESAAGNPLEHFRFLFDMSFFFFVVTILMAIVQVRCVYDAGELNVSGSHH